MKTFFSKFAELMGKETPKNPGAKSHEPEVPVPPVSPIVSTTERKSPLNDAGPVKSEPVTQAEGDIKKKPGKAKLDKKGIPILKEGDDLEEVFLGGATRKKEKKEDFGKIFEKSQLDIYQRLMLLEKQNIAEEIKSPLLVEQLKTYPPPQQLFDLHGLNARSAANATELFLRNMRISNIQTIRLIVGKGIHSEGKAVLPDVIEAKIIELKRRKWVLYYKWEKKDKRKSGSMIVYLLPTSTANFN